MAQEQIAASLYFEGVRQTQAAGLQALLRTRTARTGIAAHPSPAEEREEQPTAGFDGLRPQPSRAGFGSSNPGASGFQPLDRAAVTA